MMKNWYFLNFKPGKGSRVISSLKSSKVEYYYPRIPKQVSTLWGTKSVLQPIFPNMIFARMTKEELEKALDHNTNIINPMFWINTPAIISQNSIVAVQSFLQRYKDIIVKKARVDFTQSESKFPIRIAGTRSELNLPEIGWKLVATPGDDSDWLVYASAQKQARITGGKVNIIKKPVPLTEH